MSISNENYLVVIEEYAQKHFCKDFSKKFPGWEVTLVGLQQTLSRFNFSVLAANVDLISKDATSNLVLYKMSFRISGQNESAKSSGNRLILVADHEKKVIRILLVYNKNHVGGNRETEWWQNTVYHEYDNLP